MTKSRLEAFSDGVIAIIITVMLLDLKVPHDYSFRALAALWPELASYLLSYVMLGIYWNNHHHLFQAVKTISGNVMWANLLLLFWLSLLPFTTEWVRDAGFVGVPVATFGFVLLMCALSFTVLTSCLVKLHGHDSPLSKALGSDTKTKLSIGLYATGLLIFAWAPYVSCASFVLVALIWFVPDRRFMRAAHMESNSS